MVPEDVLAAQTLANFFSCVFEVTYSGFIAQIKVVATPMVNNILMSSFMTYYLLLEKEKHH